MSEVVINMEKSEVKKYRQHELENYSRLEHEWKNTEKQKEEINNLKIELEKVCWLLSFTASCHSITPLIVSIYCYVTGNRVGSKCIGDG